MLDRGSNFGTEYDMTRTIVSRLGVGLLALSLAALVSVDSADAAVCKSRMAGEGRGTGIAGQGTDNAKRAALDAWVEAVAKKHGRSFANSSKARSIRYDCRQGAVLEAKCVVSAVPCR